ncbi:MAG: hypothetical protein LBK67_09805 [Coriobacteriales bacterium]|jgi:hypothetical protein|nr:hypothetical protein [Coriobacteriales bacterium]
MPEEELSALSEAEEPEQGHKSSNPVTGEEKREDDSAAMDVARRPKRNDLSVLSFEDRVEHLKLTVVRNPMHREILYKALKYCSERHILTEAEKFIAGCPEFESTGQSPYHLLMFLVQGGGVNRLELDSDGKVIFPEQKEGLTEDETDDLIDDFAFETNEYGRELVERMSPKRRLLELLDATPEFYDSLIEVLEFLTEKRTMANIDTLLRGRDVLKVGRALGDPLIQPSAFVDKLEKAGGIYWQTGWIISDEGREVLKTLKERREGEFDG